MKFVLCLKKIILKKRNFLILVFVFNFLLAMPQTWFLGLRIVKETIKNNIFIEKIEEKIKGSNEYQFDSESLVLGRIITDKINLENSGKFLVRIENKEIKDEKKSFLNTVYYPKINLLTSSEIEKNWDLKIYNQQFGLQGSFFSFLYNTLNLSNVNMLYIINVLCTSFIIIYLLNWIYCEFGSIAMFFSAIQFLVFTHFFKMERNLYWVMWTWFFPMCASIYSMKNNKRELYHYVSIFYLIILPFTSILLKCLNGYEFISNILINMEIPVIYYSLKKKEKLSLLIKKCSIVGISGILGFFAAVILHLKKLLLWTSSFNETLNIFFYPIFYRTNLFGYKLQMNSEKVDFIKNNFEILEKSLTSSSIYVIMMYLSNIKIKIVIFLLFIFIINDLRKKENVLLIISILLSFIGVLSWLILAKGHSYIHIPINVNLWNIPFLMLSFAYFGLQFEKYILKRRRK